MAHQVRKVDEDALAHSGMRELWNNLVDYLQTVEDMLKELKTLSDELVDDHATFKTAVDELNTLTDELRADHAVSITEIAEIRTDFEAHTHAAKGDEAGAYFTSIPKTDAVTSGVDAGTNRTVGATAVPTITAAEATAGPATITAPKVKAEADLSAKYFTKT